MTTTAQFNADPGRPHAWLNRRVALRSGRFDMRIGQHVYNSLGPIGER
jgi:hypothetical protein